MNPKAISLGIPNRVRIEGGVLDRATGSLTGQAREDGTVEVMTDGGHPVWAEFVDRRMYVISLTCCRSDMTDRQWEQVVWSSEPMTPEVALFALASGQAILPPGWKQESDGILQYADLEKQLGPGAVVLNEHGRWRAACCQQPAGEYESLEEAMATVELFAIQHRANQP